MRLVVLRSADNPERILARSGNHVFFWSHSAIHSVRSRTENIPVGAREIAQSIHKLIDVHLGLGVATAHQDGELVVDASDNLRGRMIVASVTVCSFIIPFGRAERRKMQNGEKS